jgi:hypothetical protein
MVGSVVGMMDGWMDKSMGGILVSWMEGLLE